ncbi:polynucleotide adenylyltransferase PcnB [Candidatus Thiothrix sp. Deng01]|uniref:Poly(A) polymerase I n=1 Tax=Candidatus Thiothrix phosphatis TaxID=3112415 RepID=A0ABU6D0Z0_9GAMM|nr:polynucleotide adenylyltransferase PcnB [Candidatus Thiothrix sp. Deng01]MEB4592313.1 polynucleotide adenylyltransferase PcnB [Candidatus Thiothrix sp. Deng01]
MNTGEAAHVPSAVHHIPADKVCGRAKDVIRRLQKAGYEAYLVGGCVRDLLLGRTPKDFDIATSARPEEIRKLFNSCRLIGRRFRLAHIYYGRDYLEVATFRAPHDEGVDGGKVNDEGRIINDNVYGTLEEDVWRRDFTINALFYNPSNGELLDFVNGLEDLRHGKIRLIGEPEKRFREDPVRLLRAIRFAAKLGFEIEGHTRAPMASMAILLEAVSSARLFDEIIKLLHSGDGLATYRLLCEYGVLQHLLPLTAESLEEDTSGNFARMVELSLGNTDQRIAEGKSVMPAFLYAVLLWHKVQMAALALKVGGTPEIQALHLAATDALRDQVDFTAVPRRYSNITREIWALQSRFHHRDLRRASTLLGNARFRAAYDFLCLRAEAGEPVQDDANWWGDFQQATPEGRQELCKGAHNKKGSLRRRKRRKKSSNGDAAGGSSAE